MSTSESIHGKATGDSSVSYLVQFYNAEADVWLRVGFDVPTFTEARARLAETDESIYSPLRIVRVTEEVME